MSGLLRRYLVALAATLGALLVAAFVLSRLTGTTPPMGVGVVLPPLVGTVLEGRRRAIAGLGPFGRGELWRISAATSLVALAVFAGLGLLALALPGPRGTLSGLPGGVLVVSLLVLGVLIVLANRFGLSFGHAQEARKGGGR